MKLTNYKFINHTGQFCVATGKFLLKYFKSIYHINYQKLFLFCLSPFWMLNKNGCFPPNRILSFSIKIQSIRKKTVELNLLNKIQC